MNRQRSDITGRRGMALLCVALEAAGEQNRGSPDAGQTNP
jgi:hypothetical protein